jgi:hypothetical protein
MKDCAVEVTAGAEAMPVELGAAAVAGNVDVANTAVVVLSGVVGAQLASATAPSATVHVRMFTQAIVIVG